MYVKRYIDADPRHVELFMLQAETRALSLHRRANSHHAWFFIGILLCLFFAWITWDDSYEARNSPWYQDLRNKKTTVAVASAPKLNVQESIRTTLWKVSADFSNNVDVNFDGQTNCIDAAVRFYQYFPDKDLVCILLNYNPPKGMNHLFNGVFIDGAWRAIEPQAYYKNWTGNDFYMRVIWKDQYDSSLNKDVTQDYIKYVK
jgi:hypothetical protein